MRTITALEKKLWLSSPTMHGDEQRFVQEAFDTNWVSTVGPHLAELEKTAASYVGMPYGVALSSGTAALHLAVKLAGVQPGENVFCSDMTFSATVNPVSYEKGHQIFIDSETDTWNMDPVALEQAFKLYPNTRVVMLAHLYGTPAKVDEILAICKQHNAILIEDAAESLGATYKGKQTGSFGHYNIISYNGNKIITCSGGGMLFTHTEESANKARKWATQARENAPWYQHEELGYNYRMSNILAGIGRGQYLHLDEHLAQKRAIYKRYQEGLKDLPIEMNPYEAEKANPNCWLSCLLIKPEGMCKQVRGEQEALYVKEPGKSCPTHIMETLAMYNVESRPIWKPMHLQPIYRMNPFITKDGNGRAHTNAYIAGDTVDVGADIFARGLCLPSDNKMTPEQQDVVIAIIKECFR